jgi:hypothetical protein
VCLESADFARSHISSDPVSFIDAPIPYQPDTSEIATMSCKKGLKTKTLRFQTNWFVQFKWLHYVPSLKGVVCHICAKLSATGQLNLAKSASPAFITDGFRNWSVAIKKFRSHETSECHRLAAELTIQIRNSQPVNALLSAQKRKEQEVARRCLMSILTSIRYLAGQGLALRGKTEDEGNFYQLLLLRSDDIEDLRSWLTRKKDMTSWAMQNELLEMFGHAILRKMIVRIKENIQFSIIVDGTQDLSGIEQESICIRYVDRESLEPVETFMGLYEATNTTGKALSEIVEDVLMRFNLPMSNLRGQTYDGAANMSGIYSGCQAFIAQKQPLALYFHCGPHCINLVAESASGSSACVRDAMSWLQELGSFYGSSIKYRQCFGAIAKSDGKTVSPALKPLCPTRWLMRTPAISSAIENYEAVLDSLQEGCSAQKDTRAVTLIDRCQKASTLLGLHMALSVFGPLEQVNRVLQSTSISVSGMLEAVEVVKEELLKLRTNDNFLSLFLLVQGKADEMDLDPLTLPRQRKPPKRFTGPSEAHIYEDAQHFFRAQYFQFIDATVVQLSDRFGDDKEGLRKYRELQDMLITGNVVLDTVKLYPELNVEQLIMELKMFRSRFTYKTVTEAVELVRGMVPEMRQLFVSVTELIVLLLVNPASSATAERSFSSLRRLKTWLRSTMSQERLNACAVCFTHRDLLKLLDMKQIAADFISRNDYRSRVFGVADM